MYMLNCLIQPVLFAQVKYCTIQLFMLKGATVCLSTLCSTHWFFRVCVIVELHFLLNHAGLKFRPSNFFFTVSCGSASNPPTFPLRLSFTIYQHHLLLGSLVNASHSLITQLGLLYSETKVRPGCVHVYACVLSEMFLQELNFPCSVC